MSFARNVPSDGRRKILRLYMENWAECQGLIAVRLTLNQEGCG